MFENPLTHEERMKLYNDGKGLVHPFEITSEVDADKNAIVFKAKMVADLEKFVLELWNDMSESDKTSLLEWEERRKSEYAIVVNR